MKYYYGLIGNSYGFVDEDDPRHEQQGLIELTEQEHQQLLDEQSQGKEIVCYNGQVITAEPGLYYVDDNNQWQKKDDNDYEHEKLERAKALKYMEACTKAYSYLNNGIGLYEFEEGKHIEATDGNISKLTSYMLELGFQEAFYESEGDISKVLENVMKIFNGEIQGIAVPWSTKEDEVVNLNITQIVDILKGLAQIQANIWCNQFEAYKTMIEQAQNLSDIEEIVISY